MIWLIGCKGMLGSELAKQLTENKIPFVGTDKEIDVTNPDALEAFEKNIDTSSYFHADLPHSERQIKWIINCSAYTNVDKAEEEPELAKKLNEEGPRNIARLARKIGARLIHISTDYVFNGKGKEPYTEAMPKEPLGVYGKTKADGEDAIEKEMNQYYIIRTAWLYGFDGKNFVYTMTNAMNNHDSVKVVNDQWGTPTCTVDLADTIIKLYEKCINSRDLFGKNSAPSYGVYHYTNVGKTTWYEFCQAIYKYGIKYKRINQACTINPCTTEEYGAKVHRPAYSVLSKEKIIKALKPDMQSWEKSLQRFMKSSRFRSE